LTIENDTPQDNKLDAAALLDLALAAGAFHEEADGTEIDWPEGIEPKDLFREWGKRNTRRSRDAVADALRRALLAILEKNAPKLKAPLGDALADWINTDANPEALAAWLEKGGGEKVDGDRVEAALVCAMRRAVEDRAAGAVRTLTDEGTPGLLAGCPPPGPQACIIWQHQDAPYYVLSYDTPRADADKPDVLAFVAQYTKPAPPTLFDFVGWTPPEKATVLLGLDALKAGFSAYDWGGLELAIIDKAGPAGDWLRLLAGPWFKDRADGINARTAAQARALPLAIQSRNIIKTRQTTGAAFLRFPSLLKDAGAWTGALVEVDKDTIFAQEPDLAAAPVRNLKDAEGNPLTIYKPRAWEIAAAGRLEGPRQLVLPGLPTDPKHSPDLGAFMAVNATGAAVLDRLPGLCAKLLPLVFAMCPLDGTPVKGPVKDLVKLLYPDWKARRQMAGDVERVGAAVAALHALRLVEALPGGGVRVYPVLALRHYDLATGTDAEACFSLNPALGDLATTKKGKAAFMLVNLSRLMDLDAKSPARIAVALRLAAYWHTCKQRGQWMPDRLDFLPVDALLVEINAPGAVADVLAGADLGKAGTVQLSQARARLLDETLPDLVENGLVGEVETRRPGQYRGKTKGESWQVKAGPPPDWMEASRKACARTPPAK
jgi:hypothetical protein